MKKVHREKDRLNEELQRFRSHVEKNYVDRSQLEAVRQEERVQAQAALAPTLDQVNSYLKVILCKCIVSIRTLFTSSGLVHGERL